MNNSSSKAHRGVQHSSTLNRKYVKRPVISTAAAKSPAITSLAKQQSANLKRRQALAAKINREHLAALKAKSSAKKPVLAEQKAVSSAPGEVVRHPVESKVRSRLALRRATPVKSPSLSMKEKKDQAIESALKSVATMEKQGKAHRMKNRSFFSVKRVALALGCAVIAVGAIAYFINLSMPDLSVRVAAMQTGIDAVYPSYVPRDYSLASVVSEVGKITMTFSTSSGESFTLTEEKSSWDSSALEANYVKSNFSEYVPIREQGLTLYVSGSDCAWVNGGKVFVINASGNNLSKKQLKSIAVSL
ncbi:hypothetical protein IJF86_02705 [Candidatus Saccharibacteria bacterium]|nr:hypothetical protein [Candidatus Saccharibacteria bacterium]